VSRYQRGKTNLDFTEAGDSEWQWHQLGHMQVCTSLHIDNHASTPPLSFLQAGCPSCRATNSVEALSSEILSTGRLKEGQMVSRAEYMIVLRRKTLFYTVNLILPCVLISMLTMVVFYLPTTAGEKITMSVSIFLALIVFLQVLVTNLLPPSSLSLPLFAR